MATFAWNSNYHLEAYLAAPCMGAVLHTLNIRLFPEQLVYVVNHAQDKVILVDGSLVDALAQHVDRFETVEHYVVMGERSGDERSRSCRGRSATRSCSGARSRARLPSDGQPGSGRAVLHERDDQQPEGRPLLPPLGQLHTMGSAWPTGLGSPTPTASSRSSRCSARRVGTPYAACMAGASLILPEPLPPARAAGGLIESERVTVAGAVPTIWLDVLRSSDEHKPELSSIRMVACGGAAVPRALMKAFEERHGMRIVQAWA